MSLQSVIQVETMRIPTYPVMECETLPMFNENRQHQGTKGNPFPVMPVLSVVRENCRPRDYEVIRLENDYIRLILIPELGGRIFEAYDKVNDYHFLYRQHVIKPALIGAYGLWISGGLEFNWPFHHRPSTFMPVNFTTEVEQDGTAIAWLSECDPTDRTRATVGIALPPDAAYFETRIQVTNRTPLRHSFLMWQNGAVQVNEDYQFIFPPDVRYVTHHHSAARAPMTYPIAKGSYAGGWYDEPVDISWYKNSPFATSHFAAPSKYDFFGGYDHGKQRGVMHIADHHVSPGKKMFTWGCGGLGESWEKALTDEDGKYCELMTGSFSNNQPDFTWIEPWETKTCSEYWYPVGALGRASFATLEAAVAVDALAGRVRVQTTRAQSGARVLLSVDDRTMLDATIDAVPCRPVALECAPFDGEYTVEIIAADGTRLLSYRQEQPDESQFPEPVALNPHPDDIASVQELYLQGLHTDQYRHPQIEPSVYYEAALRRDPNHLPSLIALGEYRYRRACFQDALRLLEHAVQVEHTCNLHYPDGSAEYLLGLALDAVGQPEKAYDSLRAAAWSENAVSRAMTKAAALAGRNGDYSRMLAHADQALEASARNPLASVYAALAAWKLGDVAGAESRLARALSYDPLNDLACFSLGCVREDTGDFSVGRRSDASQTALDMAFDLADAGFFELSLAALDTAGTANTPMIGYLRARLLERLGRDGTDARAQAAQCTLRRVFPYRLAEMKLLEETVAIAPKDPVAKDLLACLLYDRGHFDRASALWREARALRPESAVYARNLAVALFSHLGRKEEALTLLETAIALDPDRNQYKLEYLYASTKAGTPGRKRLAVMAAHPWIGRKRDDYVLEIAKAHCIDGDYDGALSAMLMHDFMPAEGGEIAITGLYFAIRLAQARRMLARGEANEALEIIDGLMGKLPGNLHAGLWTESDQIPIHYYRGVALRALGREAESREAFAQSIRRLTPEQPDQVLYGVSALRALERRGEAQMMLARAIRALDAMAARRSIGWEDMTPSFNSYVNDPQTQREGMLAWRRGMIRRCEEDARGAEICFRESLSKWPEHVSTWIELDLLKCEQ